MGRIFVFVGEVAVRFGRINLSGENDVSVVKHRQRPTHAENLSTPERYTVEFEAGHRPRCIHEDNSFAVANGWRCAAVAETSR